MKMTFTIFSIGVFFLFSTHLSAQADRFVGKKIGLYISSKAFSYDEAFTMKITQFLTVGDNRSYQGRIKPEAIIRLGWMFSEQLQRISQADTIIFLNADLPRGKAMKESFDPEQGFMKRTHEELGDLDEILVISPFTVQSRIHKSVYIRSNRMITDRIPIPVLKAIFSFHNPLRPRLSEDIEVCFDNQQSEAPTGYFDFHKQASPMGAFFSKSFSQWWQQIVLESANSCE